jgi:WD40 repeat protein
VFSLAKQPFQQEWQGRLTDYVTAIAWSPSGQFLAAASAAGEVVLLEVGLQNLFYLQEPTGYSVDCLAFSHDGQFLAVAGQSGQVKIWQLQSGLPQLITTLENQSTWIGWSGIQPITNSPFNWGFMSKFGMPRRLRW